MFDLLRNLTKSEQEKQQEVLHAYLDDALTPQAKQSFEQRLAQDSDLQAQVAQLRVLKRQMRQLPQRRVPRNFMLAPQKYGRPHSAPLIQAYPILRTATALTAFFFVIALAANVFLNDFGGQPAFETAVAPPISAPIAESEAVPEMPAAEMPSEEAAEEVVQEEAEEIETEQEEAMMLADAVDAAKSGRSAESEEMQLESMPPAAGDAANIESADAATLQQSPAEAATLVEMATAIVATQEVATLAVATQTPAAALAEENVEEPGVEDDMDAEVSDPTVAQETQQSVPLSFIIVAALGVLLVMLLFLTWLTRRRL